MIANQVGAKATRDALFLSNFGIDGLPYMLIGAAVFSILTVLWGSRLMAKWTPSRVIPVVFGASAVLLVAEWALWHQSPRLAAVLVYLHVAAFGSFLISGFWSIINERFDPRTAKKKVGLIAGGGTLGGLLGGLLAERVAAAFTVSTMLPLLGVMHLACGLMVYLVRTPTTRRWKSAEMRVETSGLGYVRRVQYLRNIALLIVLSTAGATLLDYVFKARAFATYTEAEDLMRFFAVFYAAVGLGTFILQTSLSRVSLEKLGLARTIALLPSLTAVGSFAMLFAPGLAGAGIVRGGEAAMRSSLFRSGYELLYTPVSPRQKRAAKSIIDVGFDRVADAFGAILIRLLLLLGPVLALPSMLAGAIVLAGLGLIVSSRLHRGYVDALADRLVHRAEELEIPELRETAADSAVMHTLGSLDLSRVLGREKSSLGRERSSLGREKSSRGRERSSRGRGVTPGSGATRGMNQRPEPETEVILVAATDLRSGDLTRVRRRLKQDLDPVLSSLAISLLAWNEVSGDAVKALRRIAPGIVGELTDALADRERDFAIRRRIPRILAACESRRGVDGLMVGLVDRRFEVRYQSAAGLARIHGRRRDLEVGVDRVSEAILRELEVDKLGWQSRRLVDSGDSAEIDRLLEDRANLSLEHIFRMLSLFLEREPLQIALRGLHTNDGQLRGTALEYLESVLPPRIRERLWPFLEDQRPRQPLDRKSRDVLSELMLSRRSIESNLADLRKKR